MENVVELVKLMNYNMSRKKTGKSSLGAIQKGMIDLFFLQANLTSEEIKTFATNLYTNPEMFDKDIDYSDLKGVGSYFNQKYHNYAQSMSLEEDVNKKK